MPVFGSDDNRENAINQIRYDARRAALDAVKELRSFASERDYYHLDKSTADRLRKIAADLDKGTNKLWL